VTSPLINTTSLAATSPTHAAGASLSPQEVLDINVGKHEQAQSDSTITLWNDLSVDERSRKAARWGTADPVYSFSGTLTLDQLRCLGYEATGGATNTVVPRKGMSYRKVSDTGTSASVSEDGIHRVVEIILHCAAHIRRLQADSAVFDIGGVNPVDATIDTIRQMEARHTFMAGAREGNA
jgi:hypothetical protein